MSVAVTAATSESEVAVTLTESPHAYSLQRAAVTSYTVLCVPDAKVR